MLKAARSPKRTAPVPQRAAGYTLIEVGLVVLLLGLVSVMVADYYVNQLRLDKDNRRISGTVRDMQTLVDASVLWAEAFGRWPNDADVIDLDALIAAGFLTEVTRPRNRYAECADCEGYGLAGWDRDVVGQDGKGDYTSLASAAEDLVVRVQTNRRTDAELIASQLPLGHVTETDTGVYEIEARIFGGSVPTGEFVRVRNEDRPVVFAADNLSHNVQGGDLQRVGRITASEQQAPCGPDQNPFRDGCRSDTTPYVTDGPAIVFHERPCMTVNADGEDETTDPARFGCRVECSGDKQPGDACHAAAFFDQPTILLRDGLAEAPMCDYRSDSGCEPFEVGGLVRERDVNGNLVERALPAGPALVFHGTDEQVDDRPNGPVVHLLAKGAGGYAKVRVVGGLEVAREPGREPLPAGVPRPGLHPPDPNDDDFYAHPRAEYMYTLPSGQDVVTQAELDWLQCCLDNLVGNTFNTSVECAVTSVRTCVQGRQQRRAMTP